MRLVRRFLSDELGADLAENVLIVAFVAVASTAVYLGAGNTVGGIWSSASTQFAVASGITPQNSAPSGGSGGTGCHDGRDCDGH